MTISHNSGCCYTFASEPIIEKFVYSGVETTTYLCSKCGADIGWIYEPDPTYTDFIESQEVEKVFDCPIKSSNRKNSKPVIKIKDKGEPSEH